MYPPPEGFFPFALPTIPDIALLATGQYHSNDQSESVNILMSPVWSPDPTDSLSKPCFQTSTARLSPLSDPEVQSPITVDGSPDLSTPSPEDSKSPPKPTGVVRHKRTVHSLPSGTYPYTRPEAKKDVDGVKRRKVWDHVLERRLFTPEEL